MSALTLDADRPVDADLALFGPSDGWRLAPIVHWLLTGGRAIRQPEHMFTELAGRLRAAGAPIGRLYAGIRTLHPQMAAWSLTWTAGEPVAILQHREAGIRETDAYLGSPTQFVHEQARPFRRRLDDLTDADHRLLHEQRSAGMTDYLAVPMMFSDGRMNVLAASSVAPGGFSESDVTRFEALPLALTPLLELADQQRVAATLLDTYVGHRTGGRILNGQIHRGDGESICAVVWYSDLRDFTALNETLPPTQLIELLNAYFECIAAAVAPRGGEILQFIGDAALIIFDFDDDAAAAPTCEAAVDAAIDAFAGIAVLNRRRRRAGLPEIRFGVGLHIGEAMYGNVGSLSRLGFNVVGPAVNRTARLETLTKSAGVPLLLSAEFAGHIRRPVRSLGRHRMKGVPVEQEIFALANHWAVPDRTEPTSTPLA